MTVQDQLVPGDTELPLDWPRSHARRTDPDTSHAAAQRVSTAASNCAALLRAFRAAPAGLTAEEAAAVAGIDPWAASKRVSDLVREELVSDTGQRRPGRSGRPQRVLKAAP